MFTSRALAHPNNLKQDACAAAAGDARHKNLLHARRRRAAGGTSAGQSQELAG
jgi:hypothetical protein